MTLNELLEEKSKRCDKCKSFISLENPFAVNDEQLELFRSSPFKNRYEDISIKFRRINITVRDYFFITSCLMDMVNKDVLTYGDLAVAEVAISTVMLKESEVLHFLGCLKYCDRYLKRNERAVIDKYIRYNLSYLEKVGAAANKLMSQFNNMFDVPAYVFYKDFNTEI